MRGLARWCVIAVAAAAAFGPAGCAKKSRATTPTTRISLFVWVRPAEEAANRVLVKEFERSHPDLDVNLINESGPDAMRKLQVMIAAGDAPDVMSIHGAMFVPLAAKGALLDLDPLVKKDPAFNLPDFYPGLLRLCQWQGKLYSLPRYASVYILFYNKEMFDAAGVPYPKGSWTWDDFLAAAKRLTVKSANPADRRWGCAIDFWGARIYPWIWQNGGDVLSPDRKRCVLNSPETMGALQFLVDLKSKWGVARPTQPGESRETREWFRDGKIAMLQSGAWDIQTFQESKALRWEVAPLPRRKRQATLMGTENYGIAASTKHPEAAWELFKFLLSPHSQQVMAEKLDKQPSRQSVANGPYLAAKVPYNRRVFVEALGYAREAPNIPEWDRIERNIRDQLDKIWIGEVSVQAGGDAAAAAVTQALSKRP